MKAAQRVAQIPAGLAGNRVEQGSGLGGIRLGGGASLDDRDFVAAEALGCAHRRAKVLGADAPVHARRMIGAGQHVAELVEGSGFCFSRQFRRLPCQSNFALSAGAIAFAHQQPCER